LNAEVLLRCVVAVVRATDVALGPLPPMGRLVLPKRIDNWSLTSLQQRLVKTGGRLIHHARYYWLLLAENHLTRRLFGSMVRRIAALPLPIGLEAAAGKLTSRRKEGTEREFLVSAAYRGIFRSKSALQRTQYQADGCILMVTGRSIWISRFMFLMCVC